MCSGFRNRLITDVVFQALIQTNTLSVIKEGKEQLARRRIKKERGTKEGNCDFDTLNSGHH